ncbi:MAG: hypothetical protein HWN68_10390 [Desulfobacterales bacterium]|nr:hypothetical protein [Desulfobacterales bacterium]
MMICPKCGFEQQASPECVRCGVVIEKLVKNTRENAVVKDRPENTKPALFERGKHTSTVKDFFLKWLRKLSDRLIRLLILSCITWLAYSALLYLCKALWSVYIETPVGRRFVSDFSPTARVIFEVLSLDLLRLSFSINIAALKTCLLTGAVCQALSITRYFYLSRGLIARMVFWGGLCSALTSYDIWNFLDVNWRTAFLLVLPPTLPISVSCFKFTSELLPELSTILNIKSLRQL